MQGCLKKFESTQETEQPFICTKSYTLKHPTKSYTSIMVMRTPIIASSIWTWCPCLWLADRVGNRISFQKSPRNRLGTASVIPRKTVLIPRHSEIYGRGYSEARNGKKQHEKFFFIKKSCSSKQNLQHVFVRDMLRNGIPSCCLFHGMVRNRIPRVCLYFCSLKGILSCFLFHEMVQYVIPSICL